MGPLTPEGKLKCFEIPIVTADDCCPLTGTEYCLEEKVYQTLI